MNRISNIVWKSNNGVLSVTRNGEPRKDHYDLFVSFIAVVIQFTLLYFGGFFN